MQKGDVRAFGIEFAEGRQRVGRQHRLLAEIGLAESGERRGVAECRIGPDQMPDEVAVL